jgi:hypothetical protein
VRGADDDVAISCMVDLPRRPDQVLLAALLDVARADVGVVVRQRLQHVAERQAVGEQPGRVGGDVELLDVAADGVDSVTPGTLRNCGRTIQSWMVRRSVGVYSPPSGLRAPGSGSTVHM